MSTVINTNIQALNSQRSLKVIGGQTEKASERLSSGLRINRAGDDAAGLAISEKMRNQIKGLNQASRNSQDGISLIQTAEGALQETHDMLKRMRELVIQASNDSNEQSDRDKIALEVDELSREIDSTADKTEFNQKKLIDGSREKNEVYLQVGANQFQNIQFGIEAMNSSALGVSINEIGNVLRDAKVPADVKPYIDLVAKSTLSEAYTSGGGSVTTSTDATQKLATDGVFRFTDDGKVYITAGTKSGSLKTTIAQADAVDASTLNGKVGYSVAAASSKIAVGANSTLVVFGEDSYTTGTVPSNTADSISTADDTNKGKTYEMGNVTATYSQNYAKGTDTGSVTLEGNFIDLETGASNTSITLTQGTAKTVTFIDGNYLYQATVGATGDGIKLDKFAITWDESIGTKSTIADTSELKELGALTVLGGTGTMTFDDKGVITVAGAAVKDTQGNEYATTSKYTSSQMAGKSFITNKGTITFSEDGKTVHLDPNQKNSDVITSQTVTTVGDSGTIKTDAYGKVTGVTGQLKDINGKFISTEGTLTSLADLKGKTLELKNDRILTIDKDGVATVSKKTDRNFVAEQAQAEYKAQLSQEATKDSKISEGKIISALVKKVDAAIEIVSSQRAKLGAYQNRLEHTIKNLDTSSENLSASESRIRDTDMAKEMMEFTKSNVLSQAAQSMLAQANQAPNNVLSLLR